MWPRACCKQSLQQSCARCKRQRCVQALFSDAEGMQLVEYNLPAGLSTISFAVPPFCANAVCTISVQTVSPRTGAPSAGFLAPGALGTAPRAVSARVRRNENFGGFCDTEEVPVARVAIAVAEVAAPATAAPGSNVTIDVSVQACPGGVLGAGCAVLQDAALVFVSVVAQPWLDLEDPRSAYEDQSAPRADARELDTVVFLDTVQFSTIDGYSNFVSADDVLRWPAVRLRPALSHVSAHVFTPARAAPRQPNRSDQAPEATGPGAPRGVCGCQPMVPRDVVLQRLWQPSGRAAGSDACVHGRAPLQRRVLRLLQLLSVCLCL